MLRDVVNPPEQLPIDDIPSPLSAQIFELCDPDLLQEALQSSEVNSNPNCCYEENNSYTTTPNSFPPNQNSLPNTTLDPYGPPTPTPTPTTITLPTTTANINISNFPTIFDTAEEIENDISASIDFSQPTQFSLPQFLINQTEQFDLCSLQSPPSLPNTGLSPYPQLGPPLPSVYEDECLSLIPAYVRLNSNPSPSCSFLENQTGPYGLPSNISTTLSGDNSGIYGGNMYMGNEYQAQELEFQGDNGGIFCPDQPLPRIYNSSELQALSNESQHVMNGGGGSSSNNPLASEVPSLEDTAFKAAKLSAAERKEKIHRYMKKRSERNFSKKIKYACRKTLADSRPRVRGRFAKNDELCETPRGACCNHEEDTDEDSLQVVVKEEEDMVDSDIFSHISGVNSFKCNYPIQSWI